MLAFMLKSYALGVGEIFKATVDDVENVRFRVTSISPRRTVGIGSGRDENQPTHSNIKRFEIPETVIGPDGNTYYVTSISDYAFDQNTSLEHIIIPNTVESIGERAFNICTKLDMVSGGDNVKTIKPYAFCDCSELTLFNWSKVLETIGEGAFGDCKKFSTLSLPSTLRAIGPSAFQNTAVGIVSLPVGIEIIEKAVFYGCTKLKMVSIPESVTEIGIQAFGKTALTTVNLPGNIKKIGSKAFTGVTTISEINIKNAVPPSLASDAFGSYTAKLKVPKNCTSAYQSAKIWKNFTTINEDYKLGINYVFTTQINNVDMTFIITKVDGGYNVSVGNGSTAAVHYSTKGEFVIPESFKYDYDNFKVTGINNSAFSGCTYLTSITIPNLVTTIGNFAFSGCSELTNVNIPNGVTSIGMYAFHYCKKMKSVTIPKKITKIGSHAFDVCDNLTSVTIEKAEPISIESNTFSNRSNATLYVPTDCYEVYKTADYWKEFKYIVEIVPSAISFADAKVKALCVANWDTNADGELSEAEAAAVTDLGTVFQRNTEITSFNELKYFTGLQFDDQYVSGNTYSGISGFAFTECTNLKEVTLPEVEAIGDAAFMNSGLTAITLPGTVKVIRDGAFSGTGISSFVLPASVTDITYGIIEDCPNLESIVVESGNTVYDSRDNCNAIIKTADNALVIGCANTTIPATVTRLQDYAFQRCKGLGEVALSDNITSIGRNAFTDSGITSLSIGKGLSSIGESAFSSLDNLSSITIDEENATYDSRDNCNAIIRKADNTLIAGCGGTVIPATVTVIGEEAFWECGNLTSITIPATVTTIGDAAFWRCKNLQSVTVEWKEPIKISDAFRTDLTGNNAILYVPSGTKDAYEAANYWKDFKEIVEVESKPDLTVGVENVTVKEGTNIEGEKLAHFDFENDETMMGWGNDQEMGIANGSYDGSKYQTVTNPKKAEFWENQVVTDFAELVPGEAYVLHFWAKADKSFWMNANFQFPDEDAGWPSRGDFDWFEVGTEWKEYTLAATVTGTGCTRLILNIGELDGGIFCLDDVTLTRRNPLFTLTFDGFLEGDDKTTAFTTMPVATTTATNDSPAGNYPITFIGGSSEKYNIIFTPGTLTIEASENITFADTHVKEICVANWDINGDGELSEAEAAKVTDISYKFKESDITSFDELKYFTRLQSLAGWGAFFNCGSLKSIMVPKNVNVIEAAAFGGCAALESIKVDPENPTFVSVNNAVIEKASNRLVVGCKTTEIPNTVTTIGECAFFGNGELYSIQIPESVTSIDWFAFGWCGNLEEITIPATVTSIGAEAFSGCGNLNTVTVNHPEPIALDGITTFKLFNDNGQPSGDKIEATLYVPAGSIAAYKAANVWKAFGTILEQGTVLTKENRIIGNDVKVYIGYTADLQINMSNEDTFTAYQFDLELPNGITIAKDENKKYIVTKSGRYSDKSQQVKIEELGNNTFRFICVSMNNGVINGTDGAILSVSLKANAEMAEEMNNGAIKNIIMTTTDENMFCSEDCPFTIETMTLLKGDANGDNDINVVDIVSMINYIMGHPSDKFILLAADLNDDNEVDVFDVMKGLNLALKNKVAARSMARATSGTEEMVTVKTTADGMILDINDPARFTAFQFDVEVAEGVELTEARLTADAAHHTLRFIKNGQNTYRVIGMSMDNSTLSANGSGLVELSFSKNGQMQISNIIFVTPQETNAYFANNNIVVTGIGSIEYEQTEEIYDLSGHKVDTDRSRLPKGVYIINNKKVVIK